VFAAASESFHSGAVRAVRDLGRFFRPVQLRRLGSES
jgi:hypothetical protein